MGFLILLLLLHMPFIIGQVCPPTCTGNSTKSFRKNLDKVLTMMSSNTDIDYGFYNFSAGQPPNKAYVIARCRGDLSASECRSCVNSIANNFRHTCLSNNESIIYYSTCMLRYSYRSIFGLNEFTPYCTFKTSTLVPEPNKVNYRQKIGKLLSELTHNTTAGDSRKKFSAGAVNVGASLNPYADTQCSPDLSKAACLACLRRAISGLNLCCFNETGVFMYLPSCTAEFDNVAFLNIAGNQSTPSVTSLPSSSSHFRNRPGKKVYVICGIVFALLIFVATVTYVFSRRKREIEKNKNEYIQCVDYMEFDYNTIVAATENFSESKRLGKDNSNIIVYKGILPSGQEIAVRRLEKFGRDAKNRFDNERHLLTNLQHTNVVKLLGFCIKDNLRILIYEFLCNGSLDSFLSDSTKRANLEWETRHTIIQGIARGLHYLHEDSQLRVIHHYLAPSNILLDARMKPKISNFMKSSHVHADKTRGYSNAVKGTCELNFTSLSGYVTPEFMEHWRICIQSDIFSFGVLLLEIICGKMMLFSKGENEEDNLCYFWQKWSEGRAIDAIDPTLLRIKSHITIILRYFKIALLCVQEEAICRPTTAAIMLMLNNDTIIIEEPSKPATRALVCEQLVIG